MRGLSLVVESGGHSSSRCTGLSLSQPLLLRSTGSRRTGSVIVAHGPSCSVACGIFPDQGSNPCPLHWQADSQPLRHQGSPCSYPFETQFSIEFVFLLLIYSSSSYILDTHPLSARYVVNIFSQCFTCVLTFPIIISFLFLMDSNLFFPLLFGIFMFYLRNPSFQKKIPQGLRGKEYTNQFSLQSKGAVTVEDYWTECQYYDIV